MIGIIDFHSHILPGIDDGSRSVEQSLAMLREETRQGIDHVVATPHFYARYDSPAKFLKRRADAEKALRQALECMGGAPDFTVGAEVYYYSGMGNSDVISDLTIQGTNYILIEMPQPQWTSQMFQDLENLRVKQGLTPIITHIDRYIAPFRTNGIPEQLEKLPVLVQANAGFFLNRKTSRMALRMLRSDQIQLLGSDCHNTETRPPNLGQAVRLIQDKLGTEVLDRVRSYQSDVFPFPVSN